MKNPQQAMAIFLPCFFMVFGTYAHTERVAAREIYNDAVVLFESGEIDEGVEKLKELGESYTKYDGVQELLITYHVDSVCPYCGHDLKYKDEGGM